MAGKAAAEILQDMGPGSFGARPHDGICLSLQGGVNDLFAI